MIKPYSKNSKKHPDRQLKQIANSLREFGWRQPIVIDKDEEIIVGHGRWFAYKKYPEGIKDPWIIKADDLTLEQVRAYRLADNKLNESEWDMGLAIEELKGLSPEMFDLTGFDKDLLIEPDEKDDIIPENPPSIAKLGDIWQLGRHRLMCGDSTKREDVERLMGGAKADMVFTDPPYGVSIVSKTTATADGGGKTHFKGKVGGGNLVPATVYSEVIGDDTTDASKKHIELCKNLDIKRFIIWGGNYFTDFLEKSRCWLVWNKKYEEHKSNTFADVELAWSNFDRNAKIYNCLWRGLLKEGEHGKRQHPTQKPIKVLYEILLDFTVENEIIFDGFLGSGSTLIAAEKTNRICYGMEIDPHYCDVIIKRYEDYTGNKAVKIPE